MHVDGTIAEKRSRLREALEAEAIYKLMIRLVLSTDDASAFCAVKGAIPCVMHGGNRMGENMFMMVLLEAWNACTTNEERTLLVETLENYVNT
jgi:hypothetical protein